MQDKIILEPGEFNRYANLIQGKNNLWSSWVECGINTEKYGHGTITGIRGDGSINIRFDSETKEKSFQQFGFTNGTFYNLEINERKLQHFEDELKREEEAEQQRKLEQLQEIERQKEIESQRKIERQKLADREDEYIRLKIKYSIYGWHYTSSEVPLYSLLIKLDSKVFLTDEENKWLEEKRLYGALEASLSNTIRCHEEQIRLFQKDIDRNKNKIADIEAAEKQYKSLKEKYCVEESQEAGIYSPLHTLLAKIDTLCNLTEEDAKWLKVNGHYSALAVWYENNFNTSKDGWDLVRASQNWREANSAERAIRATDGFASKDNKLKAAVLTTRGGALRDMGDTVDAEACAQQSININPGIYYAYNLMGGLCFDKDDLDLGNKYFSKAIALGSPPYIRDNELKKHRKKQIVGTGRPSSIGVRGVGFEAQEGQRVVGQSEITVNVDIDDECPF